MTNTFSLENWRLVVVKFLLLEGHSAAEINRLLEKTEGKKILSESTADKLCNCFKNEDSGLKDQGESDQMMGPDGYEHSATIE